MIIVLRPCGLFACDRNADAVAPKAIETHLYREGENHPYSRIQPSGRARILALAVASVMLGWLFLRNTI